MNEKIFACSTQGQDAGYHPDLEALEKAEAIAHFQREGWVHVSSSGRSGTSTKEEIQSVRKIPELDQCAMQLSSHWEPLAT